jgi:hypothetical protein
VVVEVTRRCADDRQEEPIHIHHTIDDRFILFLLVMWRLRLRRL